MEIIKNFGVNPVLLGAQIVNFILVLFLLKKFLYKPVIDVLQKRQTTIKEGLEQAENARIKLEKVVLEEKNILKQAQLQSKMIIEDAKKESEEIASRMSENAKKQTEKMLKDAREQIARDAVETEKKLAISTSRLAVAFLEKTLANFFSSGEQKEVISQALKKMKKNN